MDSSTGLGATVDSNTSEVSEVEIKASLKAGVVTVMSFAKTLFDSIVSDT
jgi:hypothetical protein